MLLLKDTKKLQDRVVHLLARSPGITAETLHARLARDNVRVTLRAVFKVIRKLKDTKVLIKVGNCYSLRLSWAIELRNFTDEIFSNYRKKSLFYSLIPEQGKSFSWNFPDPPLADDFWRQLTLSLFDQTGKKKMFYWIRHSWFQLPSVELESKFMEVLRSRAYKLYIIVEGNTFLDRLECRNIGTNPYVISFAPSPFRKSNWGSLSVIGNYVVTLRIDRYIRNKIDNLFSKVKSAKDIELTEINHLLQLKGRCTLRVENNPTKARQLKTKFARYFGVDEAEY